jgi:hypothetical protein
MGFLLLEMIRRMVPLAARHHPTDGEGQQPAE